MACVTAAAGFIIPLRCAPLCNGVALQRVQLAAQASVRRACRYTMPRHHAHARALHLPRPCTPRHAFRAASIAAEMPAPDDADDADEAPGAAPSTPLLSRLAPPRRASLCSLTRRRRSLLPRRALRTPARTQTTLRMLRPRAARQRPPKRLRRRLSRSRSLKLSLWLRRSLRPRRLCLSLTPPLWLR